MHLKTLLRVISFACLFLITSTAFGQTRKIAGKVTNATDGSSIPGASIVIPGTSIGTVSDKDGNYKLAIPLSAKTLLVSSIGFDKKETSLNGNSVVDIVLSVSSNGLNEVVVIGYGSVKRKNVTGAISTLAGKDVITNTSSSFVSGIQGMVPGLQVTNYTGQPGADASVQLRVNPSNASSGVLYVIDGVPVNDVAGQPGSVGGIGSATINTSPLNFINPNDIESIQFLKDASSASIYGAKAGAGVILITTKKAALGKPQLNYSFSYGAQTATKLPQLMGTEDYMNNLNEAAYENWLMQNKIAPYYGTNSPAGITPYLPPFSQQRIDTTKALPSVWKSIARPGFTEQHNLSLSSNNGKTSYYISANYFDQKGVIITSDYTRYNGRVSIDQKISDHIKAGINLIGSNSTGDNAALGGSNNQTGILSNAVNWPAYLPLVNPDGTYPFDPVYSADANPLSFNVITDKSYSKNLLTSAYVEWKIIDGLTAKANFSYNQSSVQRDVYWPTTFVFGAQANGVASISLNNATSKVFDYTLNYVHQFGEKHMLNVLGGYSYTGTDYNGFSAQNQDFPSDAFTFNNLGAGQAVSPGVSSYASQNIWESYFGRVIYTFNGKYNLNATVRRDGSSVFAANKKYGTFPSVGASWIISDESFMKSINAVSSLKFRVGYGTTGNSNINGSAFGFYGTNGNYVFGNNPAPVTSIALAQVANNNLTWETDAEINFGLDFGLFKNRITGSFDYFRKTVSNLLAQVPLAADFIVTNIWENAGKTAANGYEIGIQTKNIVSENFQWNSSLNFSHYYAYWEQRSASAIASLPKYEAVTGPNAPFNGQWGYLTSGTYNGTGPAPSQMPGMLPGGIIIKDINGYDANGNLTNKPDGIISTADNVLLYSKDPKFNFGITNTFKYKEFDLSINMSGQAIHLMSPYSGAFEIFGNLTYGTTPQPIASQRWTVTNPNAKYPGGLRDGSYVSYQDGANTFWEMNATFLRCRDITLGYTIPNELIKRQRIFSALRLSVSAQNLFVVTKYPELDPEAQGNYPLPRTFAIGLNAGF